MKDPLVFSDWLQIARDIKAVDMEISGIFEAARSVDGDVPVIVVRGLSDIVGFKRDARWTNYACQSAASFTLALLTSGLLGLTPKADACHSGQQQEAAHKTAVELSAQYIQIEDDAAVAIGKAAEALDREDAPAAWELCAPWIHRLGDLHSERAITLLTYCHVISGEARRREGDLLSALKQLDIGHSVVQRIQDEYQRNFLLGRLMKTTGLTERDRGNLDVARRAFKASGEHYDKIDVPGGLMDALTELATIEENANQYGAALQYYEEIERIATSNALPGGLALARRGRATIAVYRSDIPEVIAQAEDARQRFSELKQEIGVAECEALLGNADMIRGQWDDAARWFETARGRFHRLHLPRREAGMLLELGQLALLRGKFIAAKQYLIEADHYFAKAEYRPGRTSSFLLMGSARTERPFAFAVLTTERKAA